MVTNLEENRKGLSKKESLALSKLVSKGRRIIEISDIKKTLNISYGYAKKMVSELTQKRWLERLERGKYLIIPLEAGPTGEYTEHEFIIASHLVSPYYVGFLSALNFHGLTEQTPFEVYIATTKGIRKKKIHNVSYIFVTLTEDKFFGYQKYAIQHQTIHISNPEKTIIDCLDHPEYAGGLEEVAKGLKESRTSLNLSQLVKYAVHIQNGAALKRLHYLLHLFNYPLSNKEKNLLIDHYSNSYSPLDPTKRAKGKYSSKWKLQLNISEEQLHGDNF